MSARADIVTRPRLNERLFGRTGIRVSELCFGTLNFGWSVNEAGAFNLLDAFHAAGGNFILATSVCSIDDCAPAVTEASEDFVGRWWRSREIPRSELFLATRVVLRNPRPAGPRSLERMLQRCCERSLQRLRTSHLDLLLLEWNDSFPPIDDVLHALNRLTQSGAIRYSGGAGFPAWRIMESVHRATQRNAVRFEALQADYSLLVRDQPEQDRLRLCEDYRLSFLARSPLAGGLLTDSGSARGSSLLRTRRLRAQFCTPENFTVRRSLAVFAAEQRVTVSQGALAWVLGSSPVAIPVIGVSSSEHLEELLRVSSLELDTRHLVLEGNGLVALP